MMQIENDYLSPSDFYAQLEKTVKERIEGLIVEVKTLENIDRSRGLFGYEKVKMRACGRALKTNEDFMVFFDSDYLRFN